MTEARPGESLAAILKSGERPDLRRVWDISRQVLEALEAAHARGAFHGQLRPSNVFIDPVGQVMVTHFAAPDFMPDAGAPEFLAPEQISERRTDARTDVYLAANLIYLLVTHRMPFSGDRDAVTHRVLEDRPADPSSLMPKAAWQLDWVIQRALSKDPADRFNTPREFMEGLRLGLQESLGSPLPVAKPAAASAPAPAVAAPKPATARVKPTPPESALAQKAKMISAANSAAEARPAPPEPARTKVLFVDDEERILTALEALFRADYEVLTAQGAEAAMELLKSNPVQIVVSDQRMPGMAGVELLREVRKVAPRTVRILLTGYSDLAAMVGSINEGEVFRFVKKPWDNDEIRGVMKEAAEVAAKVAPPPAAKLRAAKVAASVLVIDNETALAQGLRRMLEGVTVHGASSAAEAAKVLQSNDVAAVVADLRAGATGLVSLFKLLKSKRPNTLTLLLAAQPDSEVVVDLINQAHVHRYLTKPVNAKELHAHVTDALKRYSGLTEGVGSGADGALLPHTA
jgi:eukaryotic-like serine/threonine-protein kinase